MDSTSTFDVISFILGSILTIIIAYVGFKASEKATEKREYRNSIGALILNNKVLTASCVNAHLLNKIGYEDLRKELNENISMIFFLPNDCKTLILMIYKLINSSGNQWDDNHEKEIRECLNKLYTELGKCGVDFGNNN